MEDGDETREDEESPEEGEQYFEEGEELQQRQQQRRKKACNQRIDELSTPNKRIFLALWNEHAYHLPKDKVKHLKQLLQQLYALSPEETAKYFAELRAEIRAAVRRRKLKQKLRKFLLDKHHQKQRQRAYKLFKRLMKCGISYAAQNPVPPLVSVRLRYLSDIILEQLCDLRNLEVPDRADPDEIGEFLISVADWMAIAVERLYYAAQVSINEMTQQEQFPDETGDVPGTYDEFGVPLASSTPQRHSLDDTMKAPKAYSQMGHPLASSTPRRLSLEETMKVPRAYSGMGRPAAASTPKRRYMHDETMQVPKSYGRMGQPMGSSTPQRQFSKDKTMQVPKSYGRMGQPMGSSTPQRQLSKDKTMQVPKSYGRMGQPMGSSTPQRRPSPDAAMGQPMASSTPQRRPSPDAALGQPMAASTPQKLSLDEIGRDKSQDISDRPSLLPYYSIIESGSQTAFAKQPKSQSVVYKEPPGTLDKSRLEIPPFGFQRMSKNVPRRVIDDSLRTFLDSMKKKRKKPKSRAKDRTYRFSNLT